MVLGGVEKGGIKGGGMLFGNVEVWFRKVYKWMMGMFFVFFVWNVLKEIGRDCYVDVLKMWILFCRGVEILIG